MPMPRYVNDARVNDEDLNYFYPMDRNAWLNESLVQHEMDYDPCYADKNEGGGIIFAGEKPHQPWIK
jgi:hypothetical protein